MHIDTLADVPLYAARPSREVAPQRRAVSWILAGIVQLLMVSLLTFSQYQEALLRQRGMSVETVIPINTVGERVRPQVQMLEPNAPNVAPPLIFIPPPPQFQVERPREDAGTPEGDLLGAIGRDVACIANNYEYLNEAQRARCGRPPWAGMRMPDGVIVMAPPFTNRFTPPPEPYHMTGGDAARRAIETAPACASASLGIPCLNRVPGHD